MVEVECKISKQFVPILIDPLSNNSCITSNLFEIFHLKISKHIKSWLLQLGTRAKKKIIEIVKGCPLDIKGINTFVDMNISPLRSDDVPIEMVLLDTNQRIVKCVPRPISTRKVTTL